MKSEDTYDVRSKTKIAETFNNKVIETDFSKNSVALKAHKRSTRQN